ncbi:MAG: EamA family transporter [Candidatus Kerfeldbacteria bacterium]|nr:EamA family transporter [Candidatus Kerfeldbacteria bacterium]
MLYSEGKKMNPIMIVALLAVVGVIGDFFIKIAGHGPRFIEIKWFTIGFIIYASTAFGWFYVMKHIKLSSLGVIYALTTVLFLVAISVFYFHEKLNGYEIVGIIAAVVSLVLLSRFA